MPPARAVRVVVHHSRALVRDGLVAALRREDVVERASAADLSRDAVPDTTDVLVLELSRWSGAVWRDLDRSRCPQGVRIVGLHDGIDLDDARRALELGVQALVPEDAGIAGVVEALVPRSTWTATVVGGRDPSGPALDDVELAVLRAVSAGSTSRRAAKALGLTPHQFDDAKQRAFAKLGVGHQAHAVASALQRGLLDERNRDSAAEPTAAGARGAR